MSNLKTYILLSVSVVDVKVGKKYLYTVRKVSNGTLKEVLRRENQGLKVYPVDGSSVFSMTGTYF
jgi:hypothetical protein